MRTHALTGDGVIDFAEFVTLMHKHQQTDTEQELRQAFQVFDRDNSGSISRVSRNYVRRSRCLIATTAARYHG